MSANQIIPMERLSKKKINQWVAEYEDLWLEHTKLMEREQFSLYDYLANRGALEGYAQGMLASNIRLKERKVHKRKKDK